MTLGTVRDGFRQKMWMKESNNSNLNLALNVIMKVYLLKKKRRIEYILFTSLLTQFITSKYLDIWQMDLHLYISFWDVILAELNSRLNLCVLKVNVYNYLLIISDRSWFQ